MKTVISYPVLIAALLALVAVLATGSMLIGQSGVGLSSLFGHSQVVDAKTAWIIVGQIRLPRTLLAVTIGFTLGLSGAALQGFLRNPLADPGVIGVTSTASLGAVLALYTGFSALFPLALPLLAIGGALVCVIVLQGLAGRGGVLTLILAGVAISSLAGAATALALNFSPNPYAALEIVFWLLGSVADRSMDHVWLAAPFMIAGWIVLFWSAVSLDALSLGEESAISLGVNLNRTRALIVTGTAVSVGAATAVAGGIGFVGLVVPHLMRPLVRHSPSRLLLASGLGGAAILVASDIIVRMISTGTELRLGVVTALIGAPFFLWLVMRARMELES